MRNKEREGETDTIVAHLGLLHLSLVELHSQDLSGHSLETEEHLTGGGERQVISRYTHPCVDTHSFINASDKTSAFWPALTESPVLADTN